MMSSPRSTCCLIGLVLFLGQAARLAQDVVRYADLADVVQQARDAQTALGLRRKTELGGQRDGSLADVVRVLARVVVLVVHRGHQAVEHGEDAALGLAPLFVAVRGP